MRLSVAVMAHRKRERFVEELLPQLPGATVVWDGRNNRWDTGRRSMLAHDPDADWALVVQDDAILARDFLAGVERVLAYAPAVPVSFYTGAVKPHGSTVVEAVRQAKLADKAFVSMPGPMWGVAVAIPVPLIGPMIADCETRHRGIANYDQRMTAHFVSCRVWCWHTVPSLVNHRVGPDNPSLVPGRGAALTRTAHEWIGERSALDIDWSRGALEASDLFHNGRPQAGTRRERSMARIAPRTVYGTDGAGVRRRVRIGRPIPPGLRLEEPLPREDTRPPEARRVDAERAKRAVEGGGE
jgi:hypothetical protein